MHKFLTSNIKTDQRIQDKSKKKASSSSQVNVNQSRGGPDLLSLLQNNCKKEVSSSSQVNLNQSRGGSDLLSLLQGNKGKDTFSSSSSQVHLNQSRVGHDLLSMLQAAGRDDEKKPEEGVWSSDSQRNPTYSIGDISMSNNMAGKKKKTGWNLIDGEKTYTTYRNGGVVQGQGAEAFKLSMGDAKSSKSKGKDSEIEDNRLSKSTRKASSIKENGISKSSSKSSITKENRLPKRSSCNTNSNNSEFHSKKGEENSKKAKLCNYENLPGNGDFDFSFN